MGPRRLSEYPSGTRGGWSSLGNPGTFSVGAPVPWTADVFDPRCTDFGGLDEGWTCRFRYAPFDNLIDEQPHTRAFLELDGPLNERTNYHVEALWSDAVIPRWYTTSSYPPFPLRPSSRRSVAKPSASPRRWRRSGSTRTTATGRVQPSRARAAGRRTT